MHCIQTLMGIGQRTIGMAGVLFICLTFTGCAGMNDDFSCPMKPGHLCRSLDQVNHLVNQGKIGGKDRNQNREETDMLDVHIDHTHYEAVSDSMLSLQTGNPLRVRESILRIWVAPFEDKAGTYHQSSVVYALLRPGHWMDNPVQAITSH